MNTSFEQLRLREIYLSRLRWLVLGWLFVWIFLPHGAEFSLPFAAIALVLGAVYNLVVVLALKARYRTSLSALTLTVDSLLITLAVFVTGGMNSELWPLFFLIAVSSSMIVNVTLGAELLIFIAALYFVGTIASAQDASYLPVFAGRMIAVGFVLLLACFLSNLERKARERAEAVARENESLLERVKKFNEELETKVEESTAEVKRRYKQMEIVYKIGSELTSDIELDKVLGSIIKGVQEGLGYDRVGIFEVEEEEEKIRGRLGVDRWGKPENIEHQVYQLNEDGNSLAMVARGEREFFFTENAQADLTDIQKKYLEKEVGQNAVVPMRSKGKVIGMIAVDNLISRRPIDREEINLLMTFAGQAAVAISNARIMGKERASLVELRRMEEARQDFLSKMSHEVRTPLASIKESVGLILDGVMGPVAAGQEKFLKIAEQNLVRMVALIDELFSAVRSDSSRIRLEMTLLSVSQIAGDVLFELAPQAQKKNITLLNEMPPSVSSVHADKAKVHAVILNLVRNAIKYTQDGGAVRVLSYEDEKDVFVEVCDNGIGISAEDQKKVFEKYYKVDNSANNLEAGAGLGLAISKELVEAHGGRIKVESAGPGQGSSFIFSLPKG